MKYKNDKELKLSIANKVRAFHAGRDLVRQLPRSAWRQAEHTAQHSKFGSESMHLGMLSAIREVPARFVGRDLTPCTGR